MFIKLTQVYSDEHVPCIELRENQEPPRAQDISFPTRTLTAMHASQKKSGGSSERRMQWQQKGLREGRIKATDRSQQTNKQTESISEGCLHSSRNGTATKVFRHRERACLAEKKFTSLPINRMCRREILHHGSREIDTVGQFFDSAQFKLIHSFPHTIPFLSKEIKESKQISSIRSRNECLPTHSLISSP